MPLRTEPGEFLLPVRTLCEKQKEKLQEKKDTDAMTPWPGIVRGIVQRLVT